MWISPFFILLIHQRVDVCRASTVSPERNHSASTISPKRNYPGKEFSGAEYIMYAILVFASFFLFAFICSNLRHRHRHRRQAFNHTYHPRILQRDTVPDELSLDTLRVEGASEASDASTHFNSAAGCSTSTALKESYRGNLDNKSKTSQDSKLLSSSLGNTPFLTEVCDRLDTETKSYGDVCSHYGVDRYEMAAHFTQHGERTPRALFEYLAVHQPKPTDAEIASVLKKN